jgi:hypothetical protein
LHITEGYKKGHTHWEGSSLGDSRSSHQIPRGRGGWSERKTLLQQPSNWPTHLHLKLRLQIWIEQEFDVYILVLDKTIYFDVYKLYVYIFISLYM